MVPATAYLQALRNPTAMWSNDSSTPGRSESRYIREEEIPSSYNALRARSNAVDSLEVRAATARAEAIPKDSLYNRPPESVCRSPVDSYVPANQDPIITWLAPAANARATSRGERTPPSAHTWAPRSMARAATSATAKHPRQSA